MCGCKVSRKPEQLPLPKYSLSDTPEYYSPSQNTLDPLSNIN